MPSPRCHELPLVEVERARGAHAAACGSCVTMTMVLPCSRLSACSSSRISSRALAIEVAGRLVAEQQRRVGDDGAGDADALLLAARELARVVVGAIGRGRRRRARSPRACLRSAAESLVSSSGSSTLRCRRQHRQQVVELEDEADVRRAPAGQLAPPTAVDALAADLDRSAGRRVEPAEQVQQRRSCRSPTVPSARGTRPGRSPGHALQHVDALAAAAVRLLELSDLHERGVELGAFMVWLPRCDVPSASVAGASTTTRSPAVMPVVTWVSVAVRAADLDRRDARGRPPSATKTMPSPSRAHRVLRHETAAVGPTGVAARLVAEDALHASAPRLSERDLHPMSGSTRASSASKPMRTAPSPSAGRRSAPW